MSFAFEKTPRINLSCKLVQVQYWEYYGLFQVVWIPKADFLVWIL